MECGRSGTTHYSLLLIASCVAILIGSGLTAQNCGGGYSVVSDDTDDGSRFGAELNRSSFPDGFKFGVGSSAYQYEGAVDKGGRLPSIWDTFTELFPDKIDDGSSGRIADEFYSLYEDDVDLLREVGWDFFRFSISWPRVIPLGKISNGVNQDGVDFYNNLIDRLLSKGIQPFVTLFHWDVPQALEDDYGGFLSHKIVDDYRDYAEFCFRAFGDRVKYWLTLNEPLCFSMFGYATGTYAPGRCSNYIGNCTAGNSATEPYVVMHNLLLSHVAAVQVYRNKYQASQKGQIGMVIPSIWMEPKYNTTASREAAARALDFQVGWQAHPITYGDYPESMRALVGERLPRFTQEQSELLKGSYDFFGVNYYTARYVDQSTSYSSVNLSYTTDCLCEQTTEKDGIPIGQPTFVDWLYIYPKGIRKLMHYVKSKYNDPIIYVTENGMGETNNSTIPLEDAVKDTWRINYFREHLSYLAKAIEEGVRVKGYIVWSLLDDFEWAEGYIHRYGLTYIDFNNGLKRYLKHSSLWFKSLLQKDDTTGCSSPDIDSDI